MSTTATLPAIDTALAQHSPKPVIFIDGRPESNLILETLTTTAPLDLRTARLRVKPNAYANHYANAIATVAIPRTLIDEQIIWEVLAYGRLIHAEEQNGEGASEQFLITEDPWAVALETIPANLWAADLSNTLEVTNQGQLSNGNQTNRSAERYLIHDRQAHVPQTSGEIWTVSQTLETLSAFYQLKLDGSGLPPLLQDEPIQQTFDLTEPLLQSMTAFLDTHGLIVRRSITLVDSSPQESRCLTSRENTRRVFWPHKTQETGHPLTRSEKLSAPYTAARPWIARGDHPRVESTFILQPGWNAELQGQPPAEYDRLMSSDFSRFSNVYRRWVLNEDAQLETTAFDLAAFFDQPGLARKAIPFEDCLTLDDAGDPLPPILEVSLNAGFTWTRFGQPWRLLIDRAGVYLDPDTIDSATLTAATNQTLNLRITASLVSPEPFEQLRWQGNPFGATQPALVLDVSDQFKFRRVDAQSIHQPSISAGTLAADEQDDSTAINTWLINRLDREVAAFTGSQESEITLKLANARPEFRVGDRLKNLDSRSGNTAIDAASIRAVHCDFGSQPSTQLDVSASPLT